MRLTVLKQFAVGMNYAQTSAVSGNECRNVEGLFYPYQKGDPRVNSLQFRIFCSGSRFTFILSISDASTRSVIARLFGA